MRFSLMVSLLAVACVPAPNGSTSATGSGSSSSSGGSTGAPPTTSHGDPCEVLGSCESGTSGSGTSGSGTSESGTSGSGTSGSGTTSSGSSGGTSTGEVSASGTGESSTGGSESGSTGGEGPSGSSTGEPMNTCGAPLIVGVDLAPSLPGCANVTGQSTWCVTLDGGSVQAIGLDNGASCQVTAIQGGVDGGAVAGLAVIGGDAFVCSNGQVVRISLMTGQTDVGPGPCQAVTHWRGHLLVHRLVSDVVDVFPSFAALKMNQPKWSLQPQGIFSESIAAQGEVLYAAWHSDDHVDRFSLPCGEPLGPLALQNYDTWMQGISATIDDVFVTFGFVDGMWTFNAQTGANLGKVPGVDLPFNFGLACYPAI